MIFRWIWVVVPCCLFSERVFFPQIHPHIPAPWLTGPLLAPSSTVVPAGYYNIEPYLYITANTGTYNGDWERKDKETFWNNNFQFFLWIGLTSWLDFQLAPNVSYNHTDQAGNWALGDLPVTFDIQLYHDDFDKDDWWPNIKLAIGERIPLGKYRNLEPKKKKTDIGGGGSWVTELGIVFGKLIHLTGIHYMTARLSFQYNLPAPTRLKGFNAYGGGRGTDAKFFPAQNFQADLGMEFVVTQNWALALDIAGSWAGSSHFSGRPGVGVNGLPAPLKTPSSVQYSLAPAFEYNWNANLGMIAGSWFTVAGRNAIQFWSGIVAVNYYY